MAELAVLVALWVGLLVLVPEELESDSFSAQLLV